MSSNTMRDVRRIGVLVSCLLLSCLSLAACADAPLPARHGVVLIVLDTLRADHLTPYGYARDTSPALQRLAERSVVFEQAVSNSPWTLPSLAALLSGRHPTRRVFDQVLKGSLVERIAAAGIRTAAFTEGGYASRVYGFDRGFDSYEQEQFQIGLELRGQVIHPARNASAASTFARAREWLAAHGAERFFLLVHTYEIHVPYLRRHFVEGIESGRLGPVFEREDLQRLRRGRLELGSAEIEYLGRLYDGGILETDRQIGLLLETLAGVPGGDRSAVILTSDHGEDLGERLPRFAADHGHTLYDEQLRVPLVIHDPLSPAQRISSQVRTLDVMPTVLDLLGLPAPSSVDGRSLLPLLRGEESGDREALARQFSKGGSPRGPLRTALRTGRFKLVTSRASTRPPAPAVELYDLREDPREERNLAGSEPELRDRLLARLQEESRRLEAEGMPGLSSADAVPPELRERLRQLGYLD